MCHGLCQCFDQARAQPVAHGENNEHTQFTTAILGVPLTTHHSPLTTHHSPLTNTMWQFDESAAQFPPPPAEEPANLRGEIVEELRDHLTCRGGANRWRARSKLRKRCGDEFWIGSATRRRWRENFGSIGCGRES